MSVLNVPAGSQSSPPPHASPTVIAPTRGWVALRLRDLWEYRELFYFLIWRDVKVRYKQTLLGIIWVILQPLATMLIFTFVFGRLVKVPSDGLPYPIFAYAGLLPWQFFAGALAGSANSMVGSANLIKKVYFPRLIVPIASVLSNLVDFFISFGILLILMVYFQVTPTLGVILLPFFLLIMLLAVTGMGLWLSTLNVKYRDIRYVVPFLLQFWMYATPVVYPSSLLGEPWRTLYGLNPMVGVVEGFRWALLGSRPPGAMLAVSSIVTVLLFITGAFYFRRMEREFADVV